ncbi:MAG: acetoacetate decarboxylase family protein [Halosimplex sp.]
MQSSPERHTLSTGHEVAVPLETEAEAAALVLPADADRAAEWLPDGLAPVRIAPGRTTVTLLSVAYRRIGDDAMAPYREFGVLLAAIPVFQGRVPELAALRRGLSGTDGGLGGYVAALPVTTEPARALGVEIWGYPKRVAEIAVTDRGDRRRTAVRDDRGHVVTFETPERPRFDATVETASYTDGENGGRRLSRQPLTLSGRFGAHPFGGSYSLGTHPLAERLRGLSPGRPLGTLAFDGRFVIGRDAVLASDGALRVGGR